MRTRLRAGRVALYVLVLGAPAAGCHTVQPSTPLTVHVRDAETREPVPGATVHLWRFGSHSGTREQTFTTASDGGARARLAPPGEGGAMVQVTAPNHLTTQTTLPRDVVAALEAVKPFHPYKGPPLVVTVDVFVGPRPTAELVLPTGFRGPVKAEVSVVPNGSWPAGQRTFTYTVPANGVVQVSGPEVFGPSPGPDVVARFADGTELPKDGKAEEVVFRWVRRDPSAVYFVVGTAADEAAARAALGHGSDSAYSSVGPRDGQSRRRRGGGGGGMGGSGGRMGGGMGGGTSGP